MLRQHQLGDGPKTAQPEGVRRGCEKMHSPYARNNHQAYGIPANTANTKTACPTSDKRTYKKRDSNHITDHAKAPLSSAVRAQLFPRQRRAARSGQTKARRKKRRNGRAQGQLACGETIQQKADCHTMARSLPAYPPTSPPAYGPIADFWVPHHATFHARHITLARTVVEFITHAHTQLTWRILSAQF